MTTLIKTATKMQFESLEEGVPPVTVSRELRQRSDDQFVQDVVVLRIAPYPELMGQPEQMQAFAEMLRQTTGSFRFGGRLECHAKLSLIPGPRERGFQLAFWRCGEEAGGLELNSGELTSLARCIDVAAGMRVPDHGGRCRVQVEIGENRFKLVRFPAGIAMFFYSRSAGQGTERIEGSSAAATTLNSAMMKIRVALIEKATVWFGERSVTVSRVLSDSSLGPPEPAVMLELHGGVQRFSFTLGELELFIDALGSVLGDAP